MFPPIFAWNLMLPLRITIVLCGWVHTGCVREHNLSPTIQQKKERIWKFESSSLHSGSFPCLTRLSVMCATLSTSTQQVLNKINTNISRTIRKCTTTFGNRLTIFVHSKKTDTLDRYTMFLIYIPWNFCEQKLSGGQICTRLKCCPWGVQISLVKNTMFGCSLSFPRRALEHNRLMFIDDGLWWKHHGIVTMHVRSLDLLVSCLLNGN